METFIAALKTRNVRLPKFLLWKIASHAELEFDHSVELAEYFHGEKTFEIALLRKKKIEGRTVRSMNDCGLEFYTEDILRYCPEHFVLRISDHLTTRHGRRVFDRAVLLGKFSILCALYQKHSNMTVYFGNSHLKKIFEAGHIKIIEYLLQQNLLCSSIYCRSSSEEVLKEVVSKMPKETVRMHFLKADENCPCTASVLKKYL